MALQKKMATPYGVDVEYWIVKDMVIDRVRRMARISMGGYPTQSIREEESDPLIKITVNINFEKFDEFFDLANLDAQDNNPYKIAYMAIKKYDKYFSDSINL